MHDGNNQNEASEASCGDESKYPACFKGVKVLPVEYGSITNAWMTSVLGNFVLNLARKEKKLALVLNNCPAHPNVQYI
jgi:hypothetical protein